MLFHHAYIFNGEGFTYGSFRVENGRFADVSGIQPGEQAVNLNNSYVIPGLVDIHIHGALGADFSDGDYEGLKTMASHLAQCGITSFAPTSMTLPYEVLENAYKNADRFSRERQKGWSRLLGIHMEGPFLSEKRKGAQNKTYLQSPNIEAFEKLQSRCRGLVRIVDVAPELEGSLEFTKAVSSSCVVSLAHTDASYEETKAAINAGASHVAHLYNCMPSIHHRQPGVIGAAAEHTRVTAEIVCDGYHVHPSAVRMAFRLFPERVCLVSDALRCCGLAEDEYELGGQSIYLKNGVARLADGTIAGAATNLFDGMRNAISFGIPLDEAIRAATINPAKVLGCDYEVGSIDVGKMADFVVCNKFFNIVCVYIGGEMIEKLF